MPRNKYGTQRGWFKEPNRHRLASKGIATNPKNNPDKRMEFIPEPVESPNHLMTEFQHIADEVPHTEAQKIETHSKLEKFKEGAKKFGQKASDVAHDLHEIISEKHEKERESKRLIEALGTHKEQEEIKKHHEEIDPTLLTEHTLKEMAVRYKEPFIHLTGSGNPFKDELIRREKAKALLEEDLSVLRVKLHDRMNEFQKEIKERKVQS